MVKHANLHRALPLPALDDDFLTAQYRDPEWPAALPQTPLFAYLFWQWKTSRPTPTS